jgi:hypothetical protein
VRKGSFFRDYAARSGSFASFLFIFRFIFWKALFCKEEAHIDRSIGTHDFILDPSIPGQQENGEYRKMKALSRDLEIRVEDIVAVLYTSRDGGMNPFFSRLVT